ncbi:MAG: exosortase [Planctomycetes bacterium]|nr:exosortase [Planctomycetota bacterium]
MTSRIPRHRLAVRVVVLVGGRDFGRCPLGARLPTGLWPVGDKPVLVHLLEHLAAAGFARAAICCAPNDAPVMEVVGREAALDITPVVEELTAGTAGCLRDAVAPDPGDLILVLSGSMLAPPALEELVGAHQAGGSELTMAFNPGRAGVTPLGGPAEIYLCRPEILRHIPHDGYFDIKEGLIPSILRVGGEVRPVVLPHEVGNFHNRAGYLQALRVFIERNADRGPWHVSRGPTADDLLLTGREACVHPTARVCGPVLIGEGAQLAEGTVVIGPAVMGRGARVDARSVVVRSALWAGAVAGAECRIRECIVDRDVTVPAGAELLETTALSRSVQPDREVRPFGPARGRLGTWVRSYLARPGAHRSAWVSASHRRWGYVAGGVILLAAFLWSYWPTCADLLAVWKRSDEYSSGLLVPFLAAYIVWLRRADLQATVIRPALLWGIGAFLFAQVVRIVGALDFYSSAERLSLVLSLAALVLLVLGWKWLGKLATVLLFLCLMLPWPSRVQNAVTLPLQRWSTSSAVFCLELVGYDVQQDGNVIHIGNSSVAVAEACNGLRMITAFFVIGGLVVLLVNRTWWEKLIVLVSSLPIAFVCNTLRLAVTAVFFTIIEGVEWEQRFHDWGGYAMMPLALALVVGELWLLARLTTPPTVIEPAIIARRRIQHVADP